MRAIGFFALVGCAADGVFVEIDTRTIASEVASVELVVSHSVCQDPQRAGDCESIQGEAFKAPVGKPGDLFTRDGSAMLETLEDGIAVFELPAGDKTLDMAFAIARDANTSIVGAAVLANTIDLGAGPVIYRVALDPTEDMRDRSPQPNLAGAVQWGPGNECLGVEPIHSTLEVQRPLFILPADNPDCDSRSDPQECAPLWFDGFSFDEASAAHCVMPKLGATNGPCLLGHVPNCVDNPASNVPSCIQSPICLPGNICEECVNQAVVETCAQLKLDDRDNVPRVECIPNSAPDGQGNLVACIDGGSELNELVLLPAPEFLAGVSCTHSAQLVRTPGPTLDADRGDTFDTGTAKFKIIDVLPDCTIKMQWEGALPVGELAHTVLTIPVDAPSGFHEIWIPINFLPGGSCNGNPAPPCRYIDDVDQPDTITQCAM